MDIRNVKSRIEATRNLLNTEPEAQMGLGTRALLQLAFAQSEALVLLTEQVKLLTEAVQANTEPALQDAVTLDDVTTIARHVAQAEADDAMAHLASNETHAEWQARSTAEAAPRSKKQRTKKAA